MYGEYSKRPLIALKIICACYLSGKQTFKIFFYFFQKIMFLKIYFYWVFGLCHTNPQESILSGNKHCLSDMLSDIIWYWQKQCIYGNLKQIQKPLDRKRLRIKSLEFMNLLNIELKCFESVLSQKSVNFFKVQEHDFSNIGFEMSKIFQES